jgi:hypothetical protein
LVNTENGAKFALIKGQQYEYFIFDMRYYKSITFPRKSKRDEEASSGMYMFIANMSDNKGHSHRYASV